MLFLFNVILLVAMLILVLLIGATASSPGAHTVRVLAADDEVTGAGDLPRPTVWRAATVGLNTVARKTP